MHPSSSSPSSSPSTPRHSAKLPYPKFRVLLALDANRLSAEALLTSVPGIHRLTDRVDILVVNPDRPPTALLGGLLARLERWGVDYRLTSAEGVLEEEVAQYLRRFPGISTVVVDRRRLETEGSAGMVADLERQGHRIIGLSDSSAREAR
jgi:hypothetical protein